MRANEFLTEYRRDITAQNYGDKILQRIRTDRLLLVSDPEWATIARILTKAMDAGPRFDRGPILGSLFGEVFGYETVEDAEKVVQRFKPKILNKFLSEIEASDPTQHKEYTPWLIRNYIGTNVSLEDFKSTIAEELHAYNLLKRHKKLAPQERDINRLNAVQISNVIFDHQSDLEKLQGTDTKADRGRAETFYEDNNIRIIIPRDETASCYYGRGTKWCTAATRGTNMFNRYNTHGLLYIILPKHPEHQGEKYQLQFETSQFMDEYDVHVPISRLVKRFPELSQVFRQQALKNMMIGFLIPDENQRHDFIAEALSQISDKITEHVKTHPMAVAYDAVNIIEFDFSVTELTKLREAVAQGLKDSGEKWVHQIMEGIVEDAIEIDDIFEKFGRGNRDLESYLIYNFTNPTKKFVIEETQVPEILKKWQVGEPDPDFSWEVVTGITDNLLEAFAQMFKSDAPRIVKNILPNYSQDK